jgi:hypothetical protein
MITHHSRHLSWARGFVVLLATALPATASDVSDPSAEGLPPRTLLRPPTQRPIPEWLRSECRIGHLPGFNERMVKEFLKAGYKVVTVNCLANWDRVGPSATLYPPEEVNRADVYLRKVVDTIHSAGARAILYIGPVQVPWFSKPFSKAHPDWLVVKADGKVADPPAFGNIRSGYGDWLCEQLAYVVRIYGADGFWFDGYSPMHLHSYDGQTRRLYREFSGGDIPAPGAMNPVRNPAARRYLAWHEQHFVDFAERMRGAIRQANPEAVIFANHSGNRTWYFPNMYMGEYPLAYTGAVDVPSIELYWDVPGDALYQQFCCAFMQGLTHDRGASVWIQPSAHGISGVASPIDIQLRGLEGAPWGVYPEFVESANREEYLKLHVANVKAREAWWNKSEPLPYVGIVASEQTRTLYAQGALPLYFSHTLGAFRAVFEKHWPVRVLTESDLEDAHLQGVRVLVLPNVACLSARAAEVVRRFVKQGGGLVASFETSLYDENYRRRDDYALADLFQARYVKAHLVTQRTENLYLTLDADHPIVNDPVIRARQATAWTGGNGPPLEKGRLALIASAAEVRALEGGQVLSTYNLNQPETQNVRYPAIIASTHGKGRVVFFPASVDKGLFFYPDTYMRQLLANACRWAAQSAPPVQVDGPLLLATTFRWQPEKRRIVVHLLNDHSSYGRHSIYQKLAPLPQELQMKWGFPNQSELRGTWPIREEVITLRDIKVTCRIPRAIRATQQPENRALPLRIVPGGVEADVPEVRMHSMVVFDLDRD